MYGIALILILGTSAQWIAYRLRVPSILFLLLFGFLAGPVTHVLDPGALLKDLLLPLVSLSVAIILFEGGMSLRLSELREVGHIVRNLATIGAATTAIITAFAVHYIFAMPWQMSALMGAILMVTGPTVIGPLLRHVRPIGQIGSILKWEGIIIDPIGAMAAVLVFEAMHLPSIQHATPGVIGGAIKTIAIGCILGFLFASALLIVFHRHWAPDRLHSPLTLMMVAGAYVLSNIIQPESGLFTITVMGIVIANQKWVAVQHIAEFKETLSVLLISSLFIVLGAQLKLAAVASVGLRGLVLLAALIFIARPACVVVSTLRSGLNWRQRLFLSAMAPRGIVAAAVASVFALRLHAENIAGADLLVPITFTVIIGTVLVYGLTAAPLGRWLGLAWPNAQGCLIVGANELGRAIGAALQAENIPVMLVDTNRWNIQQARLEGMQTFVGSIVAQDLQERIELSGIGRLLALTSNDEVNSLAALHFARVFSRTEVYQLPVATPRKDMVAAQELRGRPLFGAAETYAALVGRVRGGATIHKTHLTTEFGLPQFLEHYGPRAVPLFLLSTTGELTVITDGPTLSPRPGDLLISLADPEPAAAAAVAPTALAAPAAVSNATAQAAPRNAADTPGGHIA